MSKIKVDTVETANQDVTLGANGTGVVEVKGAGGGDGTLKLVSDDGTNQVKIKSPPHSSGQSSTLVLPDNQIAQDGFLKVKSITGSGSTAEGQLEFDVISQPDLTNLNASQFTSGTIPSARFMNPSTFHPAAAAFQLVSKAGPVGSSGVTSIEFSLTPGSYFILGKAIHCSNYQFPKFKIKDSAGNALNNNYYRLNVDTGSGGTYCTSSSSIESTCNMAGTYPYLPHFVFTAHMNIFHDYDFTPQSGASGYGKWNINMQGQFLGEPYDRFDYYWQNWDINYNNPASIEFSHFSGSDVFHEGTQILLYKYLET